MIVYEFKLKGKTKQYQAVDDAIRTSQFIRNKCWRYWIDNKGVDGYDLNKYTARLAKNALLLRNSTRRQDKHRENVVGQRFLGSLRIAKRKLKARKVSPDSKIINVLLSTRNQDGIFQKIGKL